MSFFISITVSSAQGPLPALPLEFNRDHANGMVFLCSCQTYICLCPDSFSNDQIKIIWALAYLKTGRAEKWAAQVFHWEEESPNLLTGKTYVPTHTNIATITYLESTSYFQNKYSINEYFDKFLDLVFEASYMNNKLLWWSSVEG